MSNNIAPNPMSFSGAFRSLSRGNDLTSREQSEVKGTIITAAPTLTYTSIGSNLTQDQTATINGASLGDLVLVGAPVLASGYMVTAFVSAVNAVTVRIANNTAGSLTPGALVFNIAVVKP